MYCVLNWVFKILCIYFLYGRLVVSKKCFLSVLYVCTLDVMIFFWFSSSKKKTKIPHVGLTNKQLNKCKFLHRTKTNATICNFQQPELIFSPIFCHFENNLKFSISQSICIVFKFGVAKSRRELTAAYEIKLGKTSFNSVFFKDFFNVQKQKYLKFSSPL